MMLFGILMLDEMPIEIEVVIAGAEDVDPR